MNQGFDPDKFIARIGQRLVEQFDDARAATTPVTIGDAMEQPVRTQLEQILPRGIAVGQGFVIDSEGGTSKQTDVILYERDICPIFSVNNTPETTYYPCEGVIAVGEVKSALDRASLKDAFEKVASVKKLQRHSIPNVMPHPTTGEPIIDYRNYGNIQTPNIINIDNKGKAEETGQIFGFVLAGGLRVKAETFVESFGQLAQETGDLQSPNLVAVVNGGLLSWANLRKARHRETKWSEQNKSFSVVETTGTNFEWEIRWSAQGASFFRYSPEEEAFRALVRWIINLYRTGQTSDARAFDRYFMKKENSVSAGQIIGTKQNSVRKK